MNASEKEKLEKIARMKLANYPSVQIAAACALSEGRISQILDTQEYKEEEARISAEAFEQQELISQGWDSVESLGLAAVVLTLQKDPDPDFALKAAIYANKARRRSNSGVLDVGNAGARTVIHLQATFAQQLQTEFVITDQRADHVQQMLDNKKQTRMLHASQVEKLLETEETKKLLDPIGNMNFDII